MIFIDNKYTRFYYAIVNKARSEHRKKDSKLYEEHHILPVSMGGSNEKENLVFLTFREHFLVHWLLTKMVTGSALYSMNHAMHMMTTKSKTHHARTKLSSHQYARIRKAFAEYRATPEARTIQSKKTTKEAFYKPKRDSGKTYQFISPSGNIETTNNLLAFCQENKLNEAHMCMVAAGRERQHKGWRAHVIHTPRQMTEEALQNVKAARKGRSKTVREVLYITNPDGEEEPIPNLRKFCEQRGLHRWAIKRVARGEAAYHRGYTPPRPKNELDLTHSL